MAQVVAQTERLVAASPQHVRSFLLDYQNNRPRILPPEYFRDYRVEQGGDGAGTIISYWLRAGGRERAYRMRVEEPTEGGPLLMYDFAGQWAYQVGTPAKSGVSGGILAVVYGKLGISVFSPGLDAYGNSVRGIKVCEEISERLGLHVFAGDAEDALLGPMDSRKRN